MTKCIYLAGQKFEKLLVLKRGANNKSGAATWDCLCDCGSLINVRATDLRNGNTKSCGCLQIEKLIKRNTTHGLSRTKTYHAWVNMMDRCYNPKHKQYKDWGGRGITVCQHWHHYPNFLADVGEIPEGMMFDRTDNEGSYYPDNWQFSPCTLR